MDLRLIKHPDFLKKLPIKQCDELAKEIRSFLIDSVSKTGGHLSSNLGVVELTIALHKVFDSPKDKLIFDVGHQSYVHKILTGRAGRFSTLRQYDGLSGFNKRSESEHDVWEAGHSSTSLSAALGMAVVRDLNHQNHHIVAIIGDGSIINGMAFEALNHIGELGKNVIIVFNDNNMSISKNVGAMSNAFARLRASKSYNTLKQDVKDVLKTNVVGNTVLKGMTAVRDTLKSHIVNSSIFGELGIEYLGPIDGHSIKELIRAFETAKKHQGPIVIHAITQKGKGYPHSESDKDGSWHGVNQFDPDTGISNSSLPPSHAYWSSIYSETLVRLAKQDRTITAITPAMIGGSKLETFFNLFKDRSFDTGIAEEHAVTFAAAMALQGTVHFCLCTRHFYSGVMIRSTMISVVWICRLSSGSIGLDWLVKTEIPITGFSISEFFVLCPIWLLQQPKMPMKPKICYIRLLVRIILLPFDIREGLFLINQKLS
jgi:1-deoxy-D-xylulose-5-phosphate synthase